MKIRKCPKCNSKNVATERRPDGDSCCRDCGYFSKTGSFDFEKREHIGSSDCWCEPELIGDYESEGGVKHYLHRDIQ